MKKEKSKVIQLKNDLGSVRMLKELIEKLENNKLDALVLMAYEPCEDENDKTSMGKIFRYWFAQNGIGCLQCLGLLDYAKYMIRKFMFEDVDIASGEYDNIQPE